MPDRQLLDDRGLSECGGTIEQEPKNVVLEEGSKVRLFDN